MGPMGQELRVGIDLGGTKIAGIVLDGEAEVRAERRVVEPHGAEVRADHTETNPVQVQFAKPISQHR